MESDVLLEMRDVELSFGPVRVLDAARLRVHRGEVHALLGENGAGKSSLMKALYGLYPMTAGNVWLERERIRISHPSEALRRGIAMIHQELPFAQHLSVAQNIFLGREPGRGVLGFIDDRRMNAEARALLERFGIMVDPRTRMGKLSLAQQQIVAIATAISTGAKIVILDEATTALTEQEAERLFGLMSDLTVQGTTFIMITHRLDEVFRGSHRVTVMRDGQTVQEVSTADVTAADLVRAMVGREVSDVFAVRASNRRRGSEQPRLSARGLSTRKLRQISFDLWPGEVLGVAGLMGAGRTSLFNALFGVDRVLEGHLEVNGQPVSFRGPEDAIARGMAYVTEDRRGTGLALLRDVKENITLARLDRHTRAGLLNDRELSRVTEAYMERLSIDARSRRRTVLLSGGNQQKVVLAKWLATEADVYLLDEPTRGVDVGTKMEVYDLINDLTEAGKSVLLVTSELPELLALSDRFLVLSEGTLVQELSREEATPEAIVACASHKPDAQR